MIQRFEADRPHGKRPPVPSAGHRNFALTIKDAIKRDPRGISFIKSVALKMAQDQWLLADLIERYC